MDRPEVTVKQGSLRGTKIKGVEGLEYFSFLGIPYAAPPIKDLRFQEPQPCIPWNGVRDASKETVEPCQFDLYTHQITGNEDCLYLKVATTSLTACRPVMVWIYGGAFNFGNSKKDFYSPDYFMKHNVVYVSMNYRLGVHGFLNLDTEDCPGNQGLKDQVAALHWVKENIENFGGDPDNVTIFGESAGGGSVHALCLSPLAKGLFHKAIIQSGCMYCPWAYQHRNKQFGMRLAKDKKPNIKTEKEALDILRSLSARELCELSQRLFPTTLEDQIFTFGPTFDKASKNPFFDKNLTEHMNTCIDVPLMVGYTSHEGILFIGNYKKEYLEKLEARFESLIQKDTYAVDRARVDQISPIIRNYYFGNRVINDKELYPFVQLKGCLNVTNGVQHLYEVQTKSKTPTYIFKFAFVPEMSMAKMLTNIPVPGSSHSDELSLLFYAGKIGDLAKLKPNSKDELVKDRLMRLWTDFARTGNPTPKLDDLIPVEWQPITQDAKHFYEISDELTVGVNPDKKAWEFWKNLDVLTLRHGTPK